MKCWKSTQKRPKGPCKAHSAERPVRAVRFMPGEIERKSRPGVMTVRGCAFAGAKGVVWGPVKDQITISHGPIGCGQYSWWARRNYYNGQTGIDTFGTMHITTDFQEKDIVYGGDKHLDAALDELKGLFPLAKA